MDFSEVFVESYRARRHVDDGETLRGYATFRVPEYGLDIRGVSIHSDNGSTWVEMPYRTRRKPDGEVLKIYVVRFVSADTWRAFRVAAAAALDRHPRSE